MHHANLFQQIHARFREAFGPAQTVIHDEAHWALRPKPSMAAINVLLDTNFDKVTVWIFNPHDGQDPVSKSVLTTEAEGLRMIDEVRALLRCAAADAGGKT